MISGYWEHFSHCWVSCEGEVEAYNLSHQSTDSTKGISRFLDLNPSVGKHFKTVARREEEEDEEEEKDNQDHVKAGGSGSGKRGISKMYEMKRKGLGQALRNWCVIEELGDRHLLNSVDEGELFGPMSYQGKAVSLKESLDLFMERVDNWRISELYPHKCTSLDCQKRGCEKVTVVDGLWKLSYPICIRGGVKNLLNTFTPKILC